MITIGDTLRAAMRIAQELRAEGVNVEVDTTERKLDKQLKTAVRKAIPYIMFIGEEELGSEMYTIKNSVTGEEKKLSLARVVSAVKDRRSKLSAEDDDFDLEDVLS